MDKERKTHLADSAAKAAINAFLSGKVDLAKQKTEEVKYSRRYFFEFNYMFGR